MDTLKKIKTLFKNEENSVFKFLAIYNKNQLRWLVPYERSSALIFLNLYKPYKKSSIIGFFLIKLCIFLKIQSILPNVKNEKIPLKNQNLYDFGYKDFERPIVAFFIGTKGKHQKLICLILSKSNRDKFIAIKYPLGKESWNQIMKEYKILNKLKSYNNFYSPEPLKIDYQKRFYIQKCINGSNSVILHLKKAHYHFLASLMIRDKIIDLEKIRKELINFLQENNQVISDCNMKDKLNQCIKETNWCGHINQTITHGDFTPWNIIFTKNNLIKVIDWEYASISGLPFYDLYFYKYQLKKLLNKNIKIDFDYYKSLLPFEENDFQKGILENLRKCAKLKAKIKIYSTSSSKVNKGFS